VGGHHRAQVLDPLQANALERGVQRAPQQTRELDQRHSEVLRGMPGETRAGGQWQRGIGAREVVERDLPASTQRRVRDVAEASPQPEADGQRQPTHRADQRAGG
jgi:hypothetical protein